ncbi:hypothetical protein BASA81_012821 [Batrachochytrium salamandrivorans]|nr:hypothetical protein BASA81_012821 [Batrachochytrium salamandrivorans]
MLLEYRSPEFAGLFNCDKDLVVGDVAAQFGYFSSLYARLDDNGEWKQQLESGEAVGFEHAKAQFAQLFPSDSLPVDSCLTLFWMRKPLSRVSKLMDHNANERTKLVVMVGSESVVPDMKTCKELKARSKPTPHQQQQAVIANAVEIAKQQQQQPTVDMQDLKLMDVSFEMQHKMALICTASSPELALDELLRGDVRFREFADQVLVRVKRAKLVDGTGGIEFI